MTSAPQTVLDYRPASEAPKNPVQRISDAIARFFFLPAAPDDLGFCRMIFFGLLFYLYFRTDFSSYGNLPASFYHTIRLFRLMHIPILGVRDLAIIEAAFKLSLLAVCVGRYTRTCSWIAAFTGSYLLAVPNNFGRAGHGDGVIILLLWVFAMARTGDAWSLDHRGKPAVAPSGEYTWPIRMVWVLMSMVYLGAGITKLRTSGIAWVTTNNMAMTLRAHDWNNSNPSVPIGSWLAHFTLLTKAMAGGTIVLETGFFLSLFSKTARRVLVPSMFMAHVFIALVMGVVFSQFMYTYLFWIPWTELRGRIQRGKSAV